METQFTLGPFYANDGSFIDEKGKRIGCIRITDMPEERGKWIAEVYTYGGGTERFAEHHEAIEIAKLFVAAPDMFEVIKELYDWSVASGVKGPIFPKLEAAYLKATGQAISPIENQ